MRRKDGGSAFPIPEIPGVSTGSDGMSLRDYLAAMSLMGMRSYNGTVGPSAQYAERAYEDADAMLKERAKCQTWP